MYFKCGGGISVPRHNIRGKGSCCSTGCGVMSGCGASVLLQKGGVGSASSYSSLGDYKDAMGSGVRRMGRGLANSETLAGLTPARKTKPKNIRFDL
jgi:L-aminopeptidase/D-esterase-like protein